MRRRTRVPVAAGPLEIDAHHAPCDTRDHGARITRAGSALQKRGFAVGRARTFAAFVALLIVLDASAPAPAQAQAQAQSSVKSLGVFESWSAWEHGEQASKICYVSATPASSQTKPPGVRRGEIRMTISHRPGANARDEISFQAGYPIKTDRNVAAVVDKAKNFEFSRRSPANTEMIWSKDPATDKAMVTALRAGRELVFSGTSQRGTTTTDMFKLDGFGKAMDAANKACGLR